MSASSANSDGHKGRPGASYPGASTFGAYGGLTCFLTEELTRDSLFDCMKRRHHYGTTGTRMHLQVTGHVAEPATLFDMDPNLFPDTPSRQTDDVMMGDIVKCAGDTMTLKIRCVTPGADRTYRGSQRHRRYPNPARV